MFSQSSQSPNPHAQGTRVSKQSMPYLLSTRTSQQVKAQATIQSQAMQSQPVQSQPAHPINTELHALHILHHAGHALAPIVVVPEAAKEEFYRLNNLVPKLRQLFASTNLTDPDEDDIEVLAPQAQALLRTHYLLEDFIDSFYDALENLPSSQLTLRYADLNTTATQQANQPITKGRPTLLGLKALWEADWSYSAVWQRLTQPTTAITTTQTSQASQTVGRDHDKHNADLSLPVGLANLVPPAAPIFIYGYGEVPAAPSQNVIASTLLNRGVTIHCLPLDGSSASQAICRVAVAS